jgi:branched-chain amino acid transport system substrate-binding protein
MIGRTAGAVAFLLAVAGHAEAQIRIGIAAPLTGTIEPLGAQILAGVEAAVAAVNRDGGLLGEQVVIEIADDTCSEDRARTVAADLVEAGVVFVVGHLCSAASIAAAAVYAAADVIQIAPGAPDPRFTEERAGIGTFRLYGREDEQAQVAAAFLAGRPQAESIAIIDDRSPYGRRLAEAVGDALTDAGRAPSFTSTYTPGGVDFPALVERLRSDGIDAVFVAGTAADAAAMVLELARQGYRPLVFGGDTLAAEAFAEIAGEEADGTLFTFPLDPAGLETAGEAVAAIEAAGGPAEAFAVYAFAAVEIWAQAVELAGTTEFGAVANEIGTVLFATAIGTVGFNQIGDFQIGDLTIAGWVIHRWADGLFQPYRP